MNMSSMCVLSELRWLLKSFVVHCVYIPQSRESDYVWRRIQVSQVQAERQKKSLLQMCIVFHGRTADIQRELGLNELFVSYYYTSVNVHCWGSTCNKQIAILKSCHNSTHNLPTL